MRSALGGRVDEALCVTVKAHDDALNAPTLLWVRAAREELVYLLLCRVEAQVAHLGTGSDGLHDRVQCGSHIERGGVFKMVELLLPVEPVLRVLIARGRVQRLDDVRHSISLRERRRQPARHLRPLATAALYPLRQVPAARLT